MQEKWLLEAWFATLESKETNKREGKNQAGTSPRQALQTERATWNTCRQQRFPRAGKTGGEFRAWQRRKGEEKEKENGGGRLGRKIELGSGGAEREDGRR